MTKFEKGFVKGLGWGFLFICVIFCIVIFVHYV